MSCLAGFAGLTGSRPQHLLRRNGTYYLRVRVPTDLQALVGLSEVKRTLGVFTLSKAKPLALKFASRVLESFVVLQQKHYSKDEARRLVQSCFIDLAAQLDHGFVPETEDPEMEICEQENAWAEVTLDHAKAPHLYPADHPVSNMARALVMKEGRTWEGVTPASQQDILAGVGRAFAEAHRLFLFRLTDTLAPFEPIDPLFVKAHPVTAEVNIADVTEPKSGSVGPTVGEVAQNYLRGGKSKWTAKTLKSRQVRIGYLVDFLGAERPLSSVTTADVRAFSDPVSIVRHQPKGIETRNIPRCKGYFAAQLHFDITYVDVFGDKEKIAIKRQYSCTEGEAGTVIFNQIDYEDEG